MSTTKNVHWFTAYLDKEAQTPRKFSEEVRQSWRILGHELPASAKPQQPSKKTAIRTAGKNT